jgi:hypothetical protein
MAGRPMKGYLKVAATMPKAELSKWVQKALAFTRTLPAKEKKAAKKHAAAKKKRVAPTSARTNKATAKKATAKKTTAKKKR